MKELGLVDQSSLTTDEVYARSEAFEHVAWIPEGVDREAATHRHNKQTNDGKGDRCSHVI